jgi:nitrogen regulatory protein PII 2
MKEIVAFLRVNKVQKTRDALAERGYYSMTVNNALGRGRQKGLHYEIKGEPVPEYAEGTRLNYIPKRMLTMVVTDDRVEDVVDTIMAANRTGNIGDGKIFVCPIEEAVRVRTKETGERAIL